MATEKLSILTFPQRFEAGQLHVNILIVPRNINPLLALDAMDTPTPALPVFADTALAFKAMIINSLDGLPLVTSVTDEVNAALINPINSSRAIWEALKAQIQVTDGLTIDDAESAKIENTAQSSIDKFKDRSIKKYLPLSYRDAFNFTKARTKYAVTDDEYHCAVQNKAKDADKKTNREKISWGKAMALCLRNPLLAEKAGLIYHAVIDVPENGYEEGGWLYMDFADDNAFAALNKNMLKQYAARIPALKDLNERRLFAAVLFPVSSVPVNDAGYDNIIREAIVYDDGFAKIVHANQPVNHYLLKENDKSNPPMKDTGIRVGWDDEQITIWQNRQMLQKEEKTELPVDAPMGVFSYCVDAKMEGDATWRSQNSIIAPNGIVVQQNNIQIAGPGTILEVGSEIHAGSHGDAQSDGFWLPMYFVNWIGNSLAIPDKDAEEINQQTAANTTGVENKYTDPNTYKNEADPNKAVEEYKKNNTINTIPKQTFHPYEQTSSEKLALAYGNTYNFRVRLMDLTGGTPDAKKDNNIHGAQKPVETWHFKRHTGAGPLTITNVQDTIDQFPNPTNANPIPDTSIVENITDSNAPQLTIQRPALSYPAVVFTGKYNAPDAITRLKNILQNLPPGGDKTAVNIALPDPDVNSFNVLVEMKSLEMDNGLSKTGRESYIKLYEKTFSFSNNFDAGYTINIVYKDYHQLPFDGSFNEAMNENELVLPKARQLRLTFIPIVDDADDIYADESIKFGKTVILSAFKGSDDETALITPVDDGIMAIYLQPEDDGHAPPAEKLKQKQLVKSSTPVELERIADVLNIKAHNLTLEGTRGERAQFGCTKLMRHSLAPDSSSVTFSSLAEVFNHWVVAIHYTLHRDWSWDALDVESFSVYRKMRFESDADYGAEELAGVINVSRTANINALKDSQRDYANLIFLDAFDPKKVNNVFPEEVFLSYRFVPHFKAGMGSQHDGVAPVAVHLPVTIIPHQVPKLVSAGIALSPYEADDKYTATTSRQKFLWLEMEESPNDPNDTYYVRVLANAPDPMLCLVTDEIMFNDPQDPPLNINDEKIRTIIPQMDNDFAGVGAMQEMISEQKPDPRFFMMPLPPGLHADSDELFGFFTYEIRVGHKKELWSTAQARYGRPLKVNGVQHPAPTLLCNAFRRKYRPAPYIFMPVNEIVITAPFANAVMNGKNVAALPPQTSLWCFLYAQTKQADGKAYRNLLLGSRQMHYRFNQEKEDEGTRLGNCSFVQAEISDMLHKVGLPVTTSMSVLCVEVFPMSNTWRVPNRQNFALAGNPNADDFGGYNSYYNNYNAARGPADVPQQYNPLVEGLGKFRIYRTSTLVPIQNICCEDC